MNISFDDFLKLQIRIGTIMRVEEVPEADKLLKLTVDIGEETPRQIISGIKHLLQDYSTLEGKQAPFLTNLEPRVIRGMESQGMILAMGDDEKFTLLTPQAPIAPGTIVR